MNVGISVLRNLRERVHADAPGSGRSSNPAIRPEQLRANANDVDIKNWFRLCLLRDANEASIAGKRGMSLLKLGATLLSSDEFAGRVLPSLEKTPSLTARLAPEARAEVDAYLLESYRLSIAADDASALARLLGVLDFDSGLLLREFSSQGMRIPADLVERLRSARQEELESQRLDRSEGAVQRLLPEAVRALTFLFLGRYPNVDDQVDRRGELGLDGLVKRLLRSSECDRRVIAALLAGASLPHGETEIAPPQWIRHSLVAELPLGGEARERILTTKRWDELLKSVFADETFCSRFVAVPPNAPWYPLLLRCKRVGATVEAGQVARAQVVRPGVVLLEIEGGPCRGSSSVLRVGSVERPGLKHDVPWDEVRGVGSGAQLELDVPLQFLDGTTANILLEVGARSRDGFGDKAFPVGIVVSRDELESWVKRARFCLDVGHFDEAVALLNSVARCDESVTWRGTCAQCLLLEGDTVAALKVVAAPLESGVVAEQVRFWQGIVAAQREDFAGALECIRSSLKSDTEELFCRLLISTVDEGAEDNGCIVLCGKGGTRSSVDLTPVLLGLREWTYARTRAGCQAMLRMYPQKIRAELSWHLVKVVSAAVLDATHAWELVAVLSEVSSTPLSQWSERARAEDWHLLTPILAHAPPSAITDATILLRLARYHEWRGSTEHAAEFAVAAADHAKPRSEAARVASHLCQRAGRLGDASRLLQLHLKTAEESAESLLRLAHLERKLLVQTPTRSQRVLRTAASRALELATIQTLAHAGDDRPRLLLARALVCAERYTDAYSVLMQLSEPPSGERVRKAAVTELVRVCQRMNLAAEMERWASLAYQQDPNPRTAILLAKALRGLDRAGDAQSHLEHHLGDGDVELARECVKNLFFTAEFEAAVKKAEKLREDYPGDPMLLLLETAAQLESGNIPRALANLTELTLAATTVPRYELALLSYAALWKSAATQAALEHLNSIFDPLGCQRVTIRERKDGTAFDSLAPTGDYSRSGSATCAPQSSGPLVSVVMTAYNAKQHLETAARSILEQRYCNLELIIVDDASSDETADIIMRLEKRDPRVRGVVRSRNGGTYVSKNTGLMLARGEYVALQDSDDWSHPDRIGKAVAYLDTFPEVVGLTTDWIRMTDAGDVVIKAGAQIAHVCCISLVFRRRRVLRRMGFFDSVRIEADMEFIRRMKLTFGPESMVRLPWPLLFGRAHTASLTANDDFGITRTGFTKPRLDYQRAQRGWHAQIIEGHSAFMPFPLLNRKFEAPQCILPERSGAVL